MVVSLKARQKPRYDVRAHLLAERAIVRTAGAPLIPDNHIRLLKDAAENYPAWLAALESAQQFIHFESYIIHEDKQGAQFAELLIAKARAGFLENIVEGGIDRQQASHDDADERPG